MKTQSHNSRQEEGIVEEEEKEEKGERGERFRRILSWETAFGEERK